MKKIFGLLILAFVGVCPLKGDIPRMHENVIYSVHPFDGKNYYATTFVREGEKAFYLIANTDNFLSVKKTLVYYWPDSGEWMTDTQTLDHVFEGSLEITDSEGDTQRLPQVEYTYYNLQTEYRYEMNWQVATGDKAYEILRELEDMAGEYKRQVEERAEQYKKGDMETPEPPPRPWEEIYRVPPVPLELGYVVNLPPGEYTVALYNDSGQQLQGSEKKLICFEASRKQAIGYDIRPGESYTKPLRLSQPSAVVYTHGGTDLYLEPYMQNEYNEYYYNKMSGKSESGNPNLKTWVKIQTLKEAELEVERSTGEVEVLQEKPYFVRQREGTALGFTIEEYEPQGKHKGKDPHLRSFHLPIDRDEEEITVRTVHPSGEVLQKSEIEIRVIQDEGRATMLYLYVIAPFVLMTVLLVRRKLDRKGE